MAKAIRNCYRGVTIKMVYLDRSVPENTQVKAGCRPFSKTEPVLFLHVTRPTGYISSAPSHLPWLSLLTQSSFHFGQLQVMPPDRETTPTSPRSQRSLFPAYPRLWSLTNEPRTIQGWRRLPLRRPTRFRGQLRTVHLHRDNKG